MPVADFSIIPHSKYMDFLLRPDSHRHIKHLGRLKLPDNSLGAPVQDCQDGSRVSGRHVVRIMTRAGQKQGKVGRMTGS